MPRSSFLRVPNTEIEASSKLGRLGKGPLVKGGGTPTTPKAEKGKDLEPSGGLVQ